MTGSKCIRSPFDTALLATTVVFVFVATVAVGFRLLACHKTPTGIRGKVDNWVIIAALIFCYGYLIQTICGCAIVGVTCVHPGLDPRWAADETDKIFWTDFFLVIPASALVKVSILEFYKRHFIYRAFQWICNILTVLCLLWMLGAMITNFFLTSPLHDTWHLSEFKAHENFNDPTFDLAIFGIDIGLDFLVLCLPMPLIARLNLKLGQKIKVASIFALGSFCLVSSIIRFWYTDVQLTHVFSDITQAAIIARNTAMWSRIEPAASIIAACLPTYGTLYKSSPSLLTIIRNAAARLSKTTYRSKSDKSLFRRSDSSAASQNTGSEQRFSRPSRQATQFTDPEHQSQYRVSVQSGTRPDSENIPQHQINITNEYLVWKETSNDSGLENNPWAD